MTTIAYDGKIIAGDGRITAGATIIGGDCKKLLYVQTTAHRCIVAFAGDLVVKTRFNNWVAGGMTAKGWAELELDDGEFEAFVTTKDGILYFSDSKHPVEYAAPCATGSGMDFALAAMKAGKNAVEAVELASELDIYTGGEITAYRRTAKGWKLIS